MSISKITTFLLIFILCSTSSCAREPKQVVFEIADNVRGLILFVDDEDSALTFEKKSDTYYLSLDKGGIIEVRNLNTLVGYIELTAVMGGEVIPVGHVFYTKPTGTSIIESDLSFHKSHGGDPYAEKAIWKYSPSSIMNGVRTYAFFVGTLDDAKRALNEMRDKLVAATEKFGKNVLISPEEFERRQKENP